MWWSESVYAGDAALHSIYSHSHSGSLPVYSHSHSGLLPVYSHTSRLTAYLFSHYLTHCHLFSHYQAHSLSIHTQVTVYLFSHPMLLRHSFSLAHQCIRALSGSLPMYSRTQTGHLSSPTPGYLVPTIRFAAYLALVCCLATARLTTGVLSCLSIVLVLTHPHTQTCCLSSYTSSYSICALSDSLPSNLALSDLPT